MEQPHAKELAKRMLEILQRSDCVTLRMATKRAMCSRIISPVNSPVRAIPYDDTGYYESQIPAHIVLLDDHRLLELNTIYTSVVRSAVISHTNRANEPSV